MKKLFKEFGDFIKRGNVIDLAVAVVIGGAFSKIVSSLVEHVITPLIGLATGGVNITEALDVTAGSATFKFGIFLQNIIDFLIIAFVLFMVIKIMNTAAEKASKLKKKDAKEEKPAPPVKPEEVVLLEQIRDLLKKNK